MSYIENGYIQLPPDSTGKKSGAAGRLIIDFESESSPTFVVGQVITGQTSNASAEIVGIHREGYSSGEGQLYLDLDSLTGNFVVSENLAIGPTVYAAVKSSSPLNKLYYQKNVLVDRDYLDRSMAISEAGEAVVKFNEGSPTIASFGELVTASPEPIRYYTYAYDSLPEQFYEQKTGTATVTYLPNERSVLFDTGGTASGVVCRRTSHFYHPYQPGNMLHALISVACGDAGKVNVRRRWGLFDENDGFFWELDGTTLYVVLRSSVTGSPVDIRVAQSDFNRDSLDGTINFDLDITKANLFSIDVQWLGVGLVKFGVYSTTGERLVAHVFENPNVNLTAYSKRSTLPLRFECENTGTAASSSEFKSICAAIQNIGKVRRQLKSFAQSNTALKTVNYADGEKPIFTTRAKTTHNSIANKTVAAVETVHLSNQSSSPALIRLRQGTVLSGASFSPVASGSMIEYDQSASGIVFGNNVLWQSIIGANETKEFKFLSDADYQDNIVMLVFSDNTTSPNLTFSAQYLNPTASGDLICALNWKEIWL